jgi:hypothetical protein
VYIQGGIFIPSLVVLLFIGLRIPFEVVCFSDGVPELSGYSAEEYQALIQRDTNADLPRGCCSRD